MMKGVWVGVDIEYHHHLQAPKICPVVYTSLLHKVHMVSVVILHLLKLVGDESVSYVEAKQKKVRLAGITIKESQNKSC